MRLSKNFTLQEFEESATATRLGIDNSVPEEYLGYLKDLTTNVLQKVRDQFGPVIITSGYRSPALNRAVGGSPGSQHCKAQAADFKVPGHSNKEVAAWIVDNLKFDQLILEFFNEEDPRAGWIHCSYAPTNRKSVMRAEKNFGKVRYLEGLW